MAWAYPQTAGRRSARISDREAVKMKKTVFLYSGEGTHSQETGFRLLKHSSAWKKIAKILSETLNVDLEERWGREMARHRCPYSPLMTVVGQICLSDIWRRWGYRPDVVIGHSTGELAAAYQAGLYSLEEILLLAYRIGTVASRLDGAMLHGRLPAASIDPLPVNISSVNFKDAAGTHVTVSGYAGEMDAFSRRHPAFVAMKPPHPWHHPDYERFLGQLPPVESAQVDKGVFVSGVTTRFETRLEKDHWHRWLVNPVDFVASMQTLKERYGGDHIEIIEIGFHPVLAKCCEIFSDYTYASSMFRGEDDIGWILHQRKSLDSGVWLQNLKQVVAGFRPDLDYSRSLAYQGFDSLAFTELAGLLQPFFPSLAPQDFYRYKAIDQLIDRFGIDDSAVPAVRRKHSRSEVVIAGMSCRFPSAVETLPQFWEMLASKSDQVRHEPGRGASAAGFLSDNVARFDHQYFGISRAEARTMDPQQILALELTEMLWRDAGIDPQTLDRKRVGVYIGVWNQEYRGDRTSVYYPSGTNPSIIAARISYHYDLRGPSWVSNTACSSSLVALHYAAKDIEAGRVDYAVAGGVNMLLDEVFTENMRNSGFLSRENRCKTFDASADGYVRAEGGGLVLLVNKDLVSEYYARLAGSAINQNGGRSQVITAPHPEAQEELIAAACQDAGISPGRIAYLECHGTGTKIGDPIEMAAIRRTVAKDRPDTCYVGSVKSVLGHLESAAGIAGLIKAVAILNNGIIPPHLHFNDPNPYIDFQSLPVEVVTEATRIDRQANIGVSSFGFGGSNAHIVVKGAAASVRKAIRPIDVPFDRRRAAPLGDYLRRRAQESVGESVDSTRQEAHETDAAVATVLTREDIDRLVTDLFFQLTSIQEIDPAIELTDQGLDSMSGSELISQLESSLNIEINPEILFEYPLRDAFVDVIYALAEGNER
jgi:acyl transferase domain-containing protein/acyl carrier protein